MGVVMNRYFAFLVFLLLPLSAKADKFSQDLAVVFIDAATEAKYGRIPLDRSLLAQAIEKAANAKAKGVVVKFFLDLPRTNKGDRLLATAISHIPVVLQARIDDSEMHPNALADRFTVPGKPAVTSVLGESGWIPIPQFSEHAHAVCFVDFNAFPVPLLEKYRDRTVKSLMLCAAELAVGHSAAIIPAKEVSIGKRSIALDEFNRVNIDFKKLSPLTVLAFHDLIEGKVSDAALKNKVVILAYDGPNIDSFKSEFGEIGAHRLFVLMLQSFYEFIAQIE